MWSPSLHHTPTQWGSNRNTHGKEQGCDPAHSGKTQNEQRAKEKASPGADEEEQERMGMCGSGEDCSIVGWCKREKERGQQREERKQKIIMQRTERERWKEVEKEKKRRDRKSQKVKTLREKNSSG